jgi:hypothetical protein
MGHHDQPSTSGALSTMLPAVPERPAICAVDLFCGAGGLSHGLQEAGISVVAGVDADPACRYPFEANIDAAFLDRDPENHPGPRRPRSSGRPAAAGRCTNYATPGSPTSPRPEVQLPILMSKSRHTSLASLSIYANPTFDAVATATAALDPERRRR